MGMVKKLMYFIIFSMLSISLAACQKESRLLIQHSSVEFGSIQDRDDRDLHFRVGISDYGMDPQAEYNIRFIVEDPYIRELIGTGTVEVPDTYETQSLPNEGSQGLITGTSIELKQKFDPDKLRKVIEKKKAVTVEVYHEDDVIDRKNVDTFRENIMPAANFSTNAKIETIELTEANEIELLKRAIDEMKKDEHTVYHVKPDYQLNFGDESYYLWTNGKIMNVMDPYALYSLSTQSLNEVMELIGNKSE